MMIDDYKRLDGFLKQWKNFFTKLEDIAIYYLQKKLTAKINKKKQKQDKITKKEN